MPSSGGSVAGLGLASVLENRSPFPRPSSVVGLSADPQQGQLFRETMSQARFVILEPIP